MVKISLVIPVFNEAAALPKLFPALFPVLDTADWDCEILFVNDGSTDESLDILTREAQNDSRVKVITFSRNFGHQAAITAGLDFATGDAVIIMDADLQDPPELLPTMVRLFSEGNDIVSPQRVSRKSDSWFKRKTATLFYAIMRHLVDKRIRSEVGDFRLLSRNAFVCLRQFREQHRFMRGMVAWLGFREAVLPFERQARVAGQTKYPLSKMIRFSWTAICSFSALPLRMTMWLGLFTGAAGAVYLLWALYMSLVRHNVVWGWTSLVFLQCLFFGATLLCVSLIGDYIARIYDESKQRPLYVVNHAVNVKEAPENVTRAVFVPQRTVGTSVSDRSN